MEGVDVYCRQLQISESQKDDVILSHIDGSVRREIRCHPEKKTTEEVIEILRKYFGSKQTVQSLQQAFYDRHQRRDETLMEFSRELIRLYDEASGAATSSQKSALKGLREQALIGQFVAGVRSSAVKLELKRLEMSDQVKTFEDMRELARKLLADLDTVEIRRGEVREAEVRNNPEFFRTSKAPNTEHMSKLVAAIENLQTSVNSISGNQDRNTFRGNKCWTCNKQGHTRAHCPDVLCYYCGHLGHMKRDCTLFRETQIDYSRQNFNSPGFNQTYQTERGNRVPPRPQTYQGQENRAPPMSQVYQGWENGIPPPPVPR